MTKSGSFTNIALQEENKTLKEQGLKKCRICLDIYPLASFMTTAGKIKYPTCPSCRSGEQKTYWDNNPQFHVKRYAKEQKRKQLLREITLELKLAGCADCKRYIPDAMEFDHTCDPEDKKYELSMIYKSVGVGKDFRNILLEELAKGEYVCSNCHRKRTESRNPSQRSTYLNTSELVTKNAKIAYDILSKSFCIDCNEKDFIVLSFDHVKGSKHHNISSLIRKGSPGTEKQLKEELDKCVVRCSNCHNQATQSRMRKETSTEQTPKTAFNLCSCGNKKEQLAFSCLSCNKSKRSAAQKFKYGNIDILIEAIKTTSWEEVARNLKVSSAAVRKYVRKHGYDTKTLTKLVSDST